MKKIFLCLVISIVFFACSSNDDNSTSAATSEACQTVTNSVNDALTAYTNATQANAISSCENYKKALESQIIVCGDANGEIQTRIDNLKDCSLDR